MLFAESAPGTAGKEELESAVKEALAATAPDAEIVATITVRTARAAQTDVGNALQGNPDVNAVFGQNDEGALGAIGAFKAAGKDAALHHRGRRQRRGPRRGQEPATSTPSVALQFAADMAQSFDTLTR